MRNRLIPPLSLFVCVALWGALQPESPATAASKWIKVKSANFELLTTSSEKSARNLINHFEKVRSFFSTAYQTNDESRMPVRVVAFRSEKEYRPYSPGSAEAHYSHGYAGDTIVMQDLSQAYAVAVHEYVHLLFHRSGFDPPLWWNEGTAELFSSLKPIGAKVKVGEILPGRYLVLRQEKWLDLATLMGVDEHSEVYNEKDRKGIFYAQSWALVHMLNLSDKYRPHLGKLNSLLESTASPADLFRDAYGKTLSEVEKDLSAYVRQSYFNVAMFDVKLAKSAEVPEVAPATDLEVSLALANVLTGLRRTDEARQMLTAFSQSHPNQWEAEQLLGYIDLYSGNHEGARNALGRAVENGSRDVKVYVDYAHLLLQAGAGNAVAIPVLEKAVVLAPGHVDANLLLAELYVLAGKHVQAVRQVASLKTIDKKQAFRVYRTLGHAYVGVGQYDDAAKAAEQAQLNASKPEEKEEAESLLEFLASAKRAVSVPVEPDPLPAPAETSAPSEETARVPRPERADLNRGSVAVADNSKIGYLFQKQRHVQIRGVLKRLDCLEKQQARVRVYAQGKEVTLLIRDPHLVTIQGAPGAKVDFNCGPQNDTPVAIRFFPLPDDKLGTSGLVVALEFQ